MNKGELVGAIADRGGLDLSKAAIEGVLTQAIAVIMDEVAAGHKVTLVGFGNFEPRDRKERQGRNPKTGDTMIIPARTVPAFSPGKQFRTLVGGE
ncbi:MAG: HU family DNA-binding protein [Cyanobacteria bacterium J06659_2]